MTGLGALSAAFSIAVAPPLVAALFGAAYRPSPMVCFWMFGAFLFILPNYALTQAFVALNWERPYAAIAVLVALLNLAMNGMLVPPLGQLGSAIATFWTEAALTISLLVVYRWRQSHWPALPGGAPEVRPLSGSTQANGTDPAEAGGQL